MTTSELPSIDKAAIVLCCLVPEQAERALQMLGPEATDQLRELMARYFDHPDLDQLKEQVLQEFSELQRNAESELWAATGLRSGGSADGTTAETGAPSPKSYDPDEVTETDNPFEDILKLTVDQLFVALRGENPRTIGIALHQVPPEIAADVLTRLPLELRRGTFVEMSKGVPSNRDLVSRLTRAVVQTCIEKEHSNTGTKVFRTLAEMLHSVQRDDREAMMDALQESDSHAFERVDDLLFNFEDIVGIEDRTLQKILGPIDSKVLAAALCDASEAMVEKVMSNRGERVRAMISEEMEFQGRVSAERIHQARKLVVDVIREFDKAGDLRWKE
ncbi:MAG: hypothetical protein NTY19_17715 [Planctomycetota bacterium]|nr:hypothetical protein [Planctomycetota bacterium]